MNTKTKMINHQPTISRLKEQITQLKQEKELLRFYLHELVESFYKVVNKNCSAEPKTSNAWTLDPNLEHLFKGLKGIINSCPNCSGKVNDQTNCQFSFFGSQNNPKSQPNECGGPQIIKDIFAKMKSETKGEKNE